MERLDYLLQNTTTFIKVLHERFNGNIIVGFSGGKDSQIILDIAVKLFGKNTPIVFHDTKIEFKETYAHIEKIKKNYKLKDFTVTEPIRSFMKEVEYCHYGLDGIAKIRPCCFSLKEIPLQKYANKRWGKLNWCTLTGIKAVDSRKRRCYHEKFRHHKNTKVEFYTASPIYDWTKEDCQEYIKREKLKINPLYKYYKSLGCAPCPCPNKFYDYYSLLKKHHPEWYKFVLNIHKKDKRARENLYLHEWKIKGIKR